MRKVQHYHSKEDDYRRHAADTLDLAQRASSTSDKARLLMMADAWLDLAERVHKLERRQAAKIRELHPLLRGEGSEAE
jgi:hypothetical protein